MDDKTNSILIVSAIAGSNAAGPSRPERGAVTDKLVAGAVNAINASVLKTNMDAFFSQLREIFASGVEKIGAFEVSEVEISAQITADGQVALMGSGVRLEAQGGIKFVFSRPKK